MGSLKFTVPTDEKHIIELDSDIVSAEWSNSAAYAGQKTAFVIYTSFVGQGSKIEVEAMTSNGKSIGKIKDTIFYNKYVGTFDLPPDLPKGEEVHLVVDLPELSISAKSSAVPVFPMLGVTNMKWSAEEALDGDELTLSADVGLLDGDKVEEDTKATITIYKYSKQGAHIRITSIPHCQIIDCSRIEVDWCCCYNDSLKDLPTRNETEKLEQEYENPRYFFTVMIGSQEYGKTDQASGFLTRPVHASAVLEISDAFFRPTSTVLLPNKIEKEKQWQWGQLEVSCFSITKQLLLYAHSHEDRKLLIAGHSEGLEIPNKNSNISLQRANAFVALVEDNRDEWIELTIDKCLPEDVQQILMWAGCYTGPIDGNIGSITKEAIREFQLAAELSDDGVFGPKTWGAVYDKYQQEIANLMEQATDGTKALDNRTALQWAYEEKKAVGCEDLFIKGHLDDATSNDRPNRRIEVLFLHQDDVPEKICQDETCDRDSCMVYKRKHAVQNAIGAVKQKGPIKFKLFDDKGELYANQSYEITLGSQTAKETSDGDGWTKDIELPPDGKGTIAYVGQKFSFRTPDSQPSSIMYCQSALNALGYCSVAVDGEVNETTQKAIEQFQREMELPPTGTTDAATLERLQREHYVPLYVLDE